MAVTPSQLTFTEEVPASTIGDQVPNPPVGQLTLFADGNAWYQKTSAGVVSGLGGGGGGSVTSVSNSDGTIIVTGTPSVAPVVSRAAITGDVSVPAASDVATLATVNSSPGTTGDASHVAQVTTNGKGLVTAQSAVAIQIAESQVTNLTTDLAGKQAGPLTGDVTTSGAAATLATVNSNVGTFGDSTHVAQVTVNAKGLVTAASSVAIAAGGGAFGTIYQGWSTCSRTQLGTGNQLNPGGNTVYLTGVIAPNSNAVDHITAFVGTGGADSGYYGLYHLDVSNNGTLVAATALSGVSPTTNVANKLALTVAYTPIAGDSYAVAILQTTNVGSSYYSAGGAFIPPPVQNSPNGPIASASLSGTFTTLPASFLASSLIMGGGAIYFEVSL